MPSEIQSRQSANWPFTFIFSFGTNDERSIDGKPETLPFVPIRALFEVVGLASLYSYDRLHPNDAGHKLIADAVLPVLDSLLGSDA